MLAKNLDRLQRERDETNYKLAKAIGVHQTSIKNWKEGTRPHPAHIKALALHYGCSVDDLLKEE